MIGTELTRRTASAMTNNHKQLRSDLISRLSHLQRILLAGAIGNAWPSKRVKVSDFLYHSHAMNLCVIGNAASIDPPPGFSLSGQHQ
jgi:hypothetical protein